MTLSGVHDDTAQVSGFEALVSDMTERRAAEATIRFQATHDMLTQLANRAAFLSALKEAVQQGNAQPSAVFFLDLDGFKPINDMHGHGVGDALLCAVARRPPGALRAGEGGLDEGRRARGEAAEGAARFEGARGSVRARPVEVTPPGVGSIKARRHRLRWARRALRMPRRRSAPAASSAYFASSAAAAAKASRASSNSPFAVITTPKS
jgi:hypothetical protein